MSASTSRTTFATSDKVVPDHAAKPGRASVRVAAVQMHPQLGDVDANLEKR